MQKLGIDIGGSGIKGAIVDVERGELVSDRIRIPTPSSFKLVDVTLAVAELTRQMEYDGPVGVGFPAIVANGVVHSPPTAHSIPGWVGESISDHFSQATGLPVAVINDADAAGLAEVSFGAGREVPGVVMTITLGTGVGGGLFMNGELVPNLEVGKIYLRKQKKVVEHYVASRIRKEKALSWKRYRKRMHCFLEHIETVFSPDLIIIGGGISKKYDKFLSVDMLDRSRVLPAQLLNEAGIIGAALAAPR